MSAPEGFSTSHPDAFGPIAPGPIGQRRLLELRGHIGATVFGLQESHEHRAGWDRYDLLTIMGVMRRTRTLWRLDPSMDDRALADALRVQADLAAGSPLPYAERFAWATYGYHELCIRVFGEYPYRFDPREWPPEWRYALSAYVFFLRLKDASVRLDRTAESLASPERTFDALFADYARQVAAGANTWNIYPIRDPETVRARVCTDMNTVLAAAE